MGFWPSNRRAARSVNFELGEWGFCAVVWSICELGIPSSRGSIRTIFGEPRWGGEPRRGLRPGKFGKYGKSFAKRRQPASGRPKARVIPRNQHGVPPPTSRQFNQNKTAPGNSVRGGGGIVHLKRPPAKDWERRRFAPTSKQVAQNCRGGGVVGETMNSVSDGRPSRRTPLFN